MKILIIEDEPLAAERLEGLILAYESHIQILASLDSVEEATQWFRQNEAPDLVFMDIQLADGLSFDIFSYVEVKAPIIFTTAFDEYAIRAFKVNSIDYLLKPLDYESLANSLDKYVKLYGMPQPQVSTIDHQLVQQLLSSIQQPSYKNRFVVKKGEHLVSIPVEDILYFYSEEKITLVKTKTGKRYVIDHILNQLEGMLDPKLFFRLNRKYLVHHRSIEDILVYSNSRLKITLTDNQDSDVLVSKQKVKEFKTWLDN